MIRELPGGFFGINGFAIDADLKHPAAGRHQRERGDGLLEPQKFLRQTDGVWLVVSSRAIFDFDLQTHVPAFSGDRLGRPTRAVKERKTVGILHGKELGPGLELDALPAIATVSLI